MKRKSFGLTLIELVLVIMILAICGLFSSEYGYLMIQRRSLENTVRQLRYFLVYYQQDSVWLNAHYLITLRELESNWHLDISQIANDGKPVSIATFIKPVDLVSMKLNSAVEGKLFLNGQRGTSMAGNILVANSTGQYKLIISSLGRIRIQRCLSHRLC